MNCKHEVHLGCLREEALRVSDGTMDPEKLKGVCCQECGVFTGVARIVHLLGNEFVEKKREEANEKLKKQIM